MYLHIIMEGALGLRKEKKELWEKSIWYLRKGVSFFLCVSLLSGMLSSLVMQIELFSNSMVVMAAEAATEETVAIEEAAVEESDVEEETVEAESETEEESVTEDTTADEETVTDETIEEPSTGELATEEVTTEENTTEEEAETEEFITEEVTTVEDPMLGERIIVFADTQAASGSISLNQYNSGGSIVLDQDVTASYPCQLSGELTIDLNGYTMTMASGAYFMLCSDNAVLNIKDSAGGGTLYASCQLVWAYSGGTFNLYSGILDGSKMNSIPQMGGCVNLSRNNMGTNVFNMYGGTIRNFQASQYGGAVYVASTFSGRVPTFTMYGGTIENCYAPAGAAVYVDYGGDGPGYFYIKGGTKQSEGGEEKVTINCEAYNGQTVPNAIFNYGYFGLEGVVDIDGIVYLNQNNWADSVTHFIKITGRLIVTGDGYIDIDSAYPNSNGICTGHTVIENVTQTVGGTGVTISQEEFYTYGSYFVNSTKGLMVSAGFDPTKQGMSNNYPANWPTYQADMYSTTYTYVDVMGQTMIIQASDSPSDKRQMQNYNYLIYTARADLSEDYAEYYSIKISKRDIETGNTLDGAKFSVKKKAVDEDGNVTYENIGISGSTGDSTDGVGSGETYIYLGEERDGKLMIAEGTYVLVETQAPADYIARGELATIEIGHKPDESTGQLVSVVEVVANNKVLTTTEQVINSSFGDKGWLVNKEIVLYLNNSKGVIQENTDYKIRIEKYQDEDYQMSLGRAGFVLNTTGEDSELAAEGVTDENGVLNLLDLNGSEFTFSNGDSYELSESIAPEDYYLMEDKISLSVNDENQVVVGGSVMSDGQTITMADVGADAEHGGWSAVLSEELLTIKVYDEQMPPTWTLQARKYGTKEMEALALAGAKFILYKSESIDGMQAETEVVSVISSDGSDGNAKGTLSFTDSEGNPIELVCNATYILRETYAPQGYELMKDIIFTVNEDGSAIDVSQSETTYRGASYDAENRILTLSIVNKAVYQMPQTGGISIYPFITGGSILMCVCLVCLQLLLSRKKQGQ